ncbi:MAG: hypothetical protein BYD32DRAFT_460212 [Podila humilis]|nr:MAG: hypothetical protein BYD32DRAFT_460212 [Podila humilis]
MFGPSRSSSSSGLLDQYNVLILGETQSGKSTLIQYMQKYVHPNVKINTDALGTGFLYHTRRVNITTITTNLPEYEVVDKKAPKGINVDYGEFLKIPDAYEYEDALNMRKGLEMKQGTPRLTKKVNFSLIDTPGLNSITGVDEANIQNIFQALNDAKIIHLLLITISSEPFTQSAIKAYVDMFPDFNGIIAFVHTHFDYKNFHPARSQAAHAVDLRTQSLHTIMGRETFPHFKIDCDVYNKKPIRECITQNTIQKILELAIFNRPVDTLQTVTLRSKDKEEGDLLTEILRNETTAHKLEAQIKVLDEFFVRHDVELLEILHEDRWDMDYAVDNQGKFSIRYPQQGVQRVASSG